MATRKRTQKPSKARRKPKQARSQFLVDAIMTATAQLLRELGPEETTTNRVAKRAGVSVGSLYQYFPNKTALYTELARRHVANLEAELEPLLARVATEPLAELSATVVASVFAITTVDAPLHAALHRLSLWGQTSGVMMALRLRTEEQLGLLLRLRQDDFPTPLADPDVAARVLVRAIGGQLDAALCDEPGAASDPKLLRETTRLVASYLMMPAELPR